MRCIKCGSEIIEEEDPEGIFTLIPTCECDPEKDSEWEPEWYDSDWVQAGWDSPSGFSQ